MSRRFLREHALQALYAFQFSQNTVEQVLHDPLLDLPDEVRNDQFFRELFDTTARCQIELDLLIERISQNWQLSRMAFTDRLILRMALAEMLYFPDIPPKVTIDEAIELAKKYSTEESSRFINGILDKLLSELNKANKITKSGKGLVDLASKRGRKGSATQ